MKLTTLQTEVLNTNLMPALELAESLYKQSQCNGRKHARLQHRQAQLKHLSILIDDINGALQRG